MLIARKKVYSDEKLFLSLCRYQTALNTDYKWWKDRRYIVFMMPP